MTSDGRIRRTFISALTTIAILGSGLVLGTAVAADVEEPLPSPPPLLQRDDNVVAGDPLPTVQIDDGYVWSQAVVGTTVYAVGQFDNARAPLEAPGTSLTPRSNILAFDIDSGELLSFEPTVNGVVRAVAASPDGSRIYIGGSFNSVNGETRWNVAALDAQTGELVPSFNPSIGGSGVYALAVDSDTLYLGGLFTQANGTPRQNLAAFAASNGALRINWDSQPDLQVDAMVLDPDDEHVVVGGRFGSVDGDGRWRGMASINASSGDVNSSWQGTEKVKNGWSSGSNSGRAGIFALTADDLAVYGTGWVFANAQIGNLEGVVKLESTSGETEWLFDCLGDNYGVYSTGSVVYTTTHTHACTTMGLFPEQSPRVHTFIHAMTADVRGTLGRQPHAGSTYVNWEGENAPSVYAWYPDFFTGTASGMNQAGLSITGTGNMISVAGEFPGVNNRHFQGIVRFSTTPPAGPQDGPRTTTTEWGAPSVNTAVPGRITVSINGTWDRDDLDLTYELTRDGADEVVDSVTHSKSWWDTPVVRLVDSTVDAGQSYTYRITVKDGDGNSVVSQPVAATASTEESLEYSSAVIEDGATLYYPLGDIGADWAGTNQPGVGNGVQAREPSAVQGSGTGYSSFTGNSSGRVSSSVQDAGPAEFSAELWFNSSTSSGGKLIGFGSARTNLSGSYDRHIYMRNNGRLSFGVYPGTAQVITSPSSYNDGQWHHVVATLSNDGMKLYVDGQQVATDPTTTSGQAFNGYWRIGGDNMSGWPGSPSSNWFSGSLDEVAIYPHALDETQVATHYAIGSGYEAPTASFTVDADELTIEVDGSESTAAADGSLVEFIWDFGEGSPIQPGTSSSVTYTYAEAGSYEVSLTVRDDRGLVSTAKQDVSVLGPNVVPTAAFESTVNGLTVTVDGSSSTDEDGTIESYEWDWGDDSDPGSGETAVHNYTTAGEYTITLTVTDGDGATGSHSIEVIVEDQDPVGDPIRDEFDRIRTASWGEADIGGPWTITGGAASAASVSNGRAKFELLAGSTRIAMLSHSSVQEYSANVEFSTDVEPGSGAAYADVVVRDNGAGTYLVRTWLRPDGSIWLVAQNGTAVLRTSPVADLTYEAGGPFLLKLEVTGTDATQIRARLWNAESAEPSVWHLSVQDDSPELQGTGSFGLRGSRASAASSPATIAFHQLRVEAIE